MYVAMQSAGVLLMEVPEPRFDFARAMRGPAQAIADHLRFELGVEITTGPAGRDREARQRRCIAGVVARTHTNA